jgi:hypothetical protein
MPKKDVGQLVDELRERGYVVAFNRRKSHWHVSTPKGTPVTTFGSSPSSFRWKSNAVGYIRRFERQNGTP